MLKLGSSFLKLQSFSEHTLLVSIYRFFFQQDNFGVENASISDLTNNGWLENWKNVNDTILIILLHFESDPKRFQILLVKHAESYTKFLPSHLWMIRNKSLYILVIFSYSCKFQSKISVKQEIHHITILNIYVTCLHLGL